jgi:hypothetical protein
MKDNELLPFTPGTLNSSDPRANKSDPKEDIRCFKQAVKLKQDILSTASLLQTTSISSKNALSDSAALINAYTNKALIQVNLLHTRYLELGDSIITQEKLLRAKGDHSRSSSALDAEGNVQHLIIVPEHFSRKDHWQKLLTCHKCCKKSTARQDNCSKNESKHYCQCSSELEKKKNTVILSSSPWEGSQYKLTLVTSLRKKVLLKFILTALSQYAAVQKFRREAVIAGCQKRHDNLLKQCFYSILFEALSNRYIIINGNNSAYKLIQKKYMNPAFAKLVRLLTLRSLYNLHTKMADKWRYKSHLKIGLTALIINKNTSKLLAIKSEWATEHVPKLTQSHAFFAWMLAMVRKNTVKSMLSKRFSSFSLSAESEVSSDEESDMSELFGITDPNPRPNRNLNPRAGRDESREFTSRREESRLSDVRWVKELKGLMNEDDEDLRLFQE